MKTRCFCSVVILKSESAHYYCPDGYKFTGASDRVKTKSSVWFEVSPTAAEAWTFQMPSSVLPVFIYLLLRTNFNTINGGLALQHDKNVLYYTTCELRPPSQESVHNK